MTNNPFWDAAEDALRGERVRVHTTDGTYTGLLTLFHYQDHAVLLRDVTTPDGDATPTTLVRDPKTIEQQPETASREVATADVDAIASQPYSVREYDSPDFAAFVRQVRHDGGLTNLSLLRPLDGDHDATHQVVSGHRRVEALRRAGIDEHPVEVESFTDWAATRRFIDEHFPVTDSERENCTDSRGGWYPPELMQASYERLREEWGREKLLGHPAIKANEAVLEAVDGAAADVHDVLTGASSEEGAADESTGDSDTSEIDDVVADLAADADAGEEQIRDDVTTLREHEVPLDAVKGALRRKYAGE